ncbi:MAG: hypothetical protein JWN06_1651 [Propionibacteriaceae bacterium]|nr:hypothetical protein [Propionibacteriaceae bacterium]
MTVTDVSPPTQSSTPAPRTRSEPHHVVLVVLGVLLAILGLGLTGAAATLGAVLFQQHSQGYLTSPTERLHVDSYAITSEQLDVVIDDGLPSAARSGPVASFLLRGTSAVHGQDIFVGVGPRAEVTAYLADVERSELTQVRFNPFRATYRTIAGSQAPALPASQDFWTVSAQGPGAQQIEADLRSGRWTSVIMNADGSKPVAVDLQAGVRSRFLAPVTLGSLIAGIALLAIGIPMIVAGAHGLGRSSTPPTASHASGSGASPSAPFRGTGALAEHVYVSYPARLTGELDPHLSRWMWLVKWFLAIPHNIVLAFLWVAFVVTTVIAGFAILFTGRYPRSLFDFNVGVLRWSWRVAFYAYTAVGTDRYPPFTLARTDYPADFDVDYPEHLSHGLVLVKSWLLAIPHLIIVGLFTSNVFSWWSTRGDWNLGSPGATGISLLGVLVLVASVVLLVTRKYPPALFNLILGINRWGFRVLTYVALMRDEYPPFHLDQGQRDPGDTPVRGPVNTPEPVSVTR